MCPDDEAAREARARELQEEIDKVVEGQGVEGSTPPPPPPDDRKENPREFIHRRMRELDRRKRK